MKYWYAIKVDIRYSNVNSHSSHYSIAFIGKPCSVLLDQFIAQQSKEKQILCNGYCRKQKRNGDKWCGRDLWIKQQQKKNKIIITTTKYCVSKDNATIGIYSMPCNFDD